MPPVSLVSKQPLVIAADTSARHGPVFLQRLDRLPRRPASQAVTHDYVALAFYTGGSAAIEQRGRWSLRAGDVMLIPPGEPHRLLDADSPQIWGLGFHPVSVLAEGGAALLDPFERVRSGAAAVVTIPAQRRAFLCTLFDELQREVEDMDRPVPAVQHSFLTLILAEVARAASGQHRPTAPAGAGDSAATGAMTSVVIDTLRFIERRCLEPISLQDVARAAGRSPAHLTTVLRRATGRSVHAWITAGRMSEARRRLARTDERIDIIAERVGYADATHFIRLFRREHGMTPAAWRKRHGTGSDS